jgi:hypothetical protein
MESHEVRDITLQDGSTQSMDVFRGTLMKADGTTPETQCEWIDSKQPHTIGECINPATKRPFGQTTLNDLVKRVG